MKQLTLFEEGEYQPRFQAYLDYVGAVNHSEVKMYEFIIWISTHAEKFKEIHRTNFIRLEQQTEFTKYLQEISRGRQYENQA